MKNTLLDEETNNSANCEKRQNKEQITYSWPLFLKDQFARCWNDQCLDCFHPTLLHSQLHSFQLLKFHHQSCPLPPKQNKGFILSTSNDVWTDVRQAKLENLYWCDWTILRTMLQRVSFCFLISLGARRGNLQNHRNNKTPYTLCDPNRLERGQSFSVTMLHSSIDLDEHKVFSKHLHKM